MAKTFSLSFPNDEAQKIELEAAEKGINTNQLLRELIRDRLPVEASTQPVPTSPQLQQLINQLHQLKEQSDRMQEAMQHLLQSNSVNASPQVNQQIQDALHPISSRFQQVESRLLKLCEAMEKLTAVLESDRALVPRVIQRQEGFLEAVYVLVEKVLLYTSPEEFKAINQKLVDEMHTQLEKFLEN
jgi:hypothetical protein